ncbi:MAG: excinuclease ABC subunit UvrC [Nitrospirae bacterium]|nr:excinuclease ABC subunit UvrC [Nitrospirota bacterium]
MKLKTVPELPGVYLFRDAKERVLYVGKAISLRKRLRNYFRANLAEIEPRKAGLMELAMDFTFIVTENEVEALALEANLIKQYRPRFNVILKDDKGYPYLRITTTEKWPRIEVVRRFSRDGNVYIGPYVSSRSLRESLDFIRKYFTIRPCIYKLDSIGRHCVEHEIGRCSAPCVGKVDKEEYDGEVNNVIEFLKGNRRELLDKLTAKMNAFAEVLEFEKAARYRDKIGAIRSAWEMQKVVAPELGDMDVIGFYRASPEAWAVSRASEEVQHPLVESGRRPPAERENVNEEGRDENQYDSYRQGRDEGIFNVFFVRHGVLIGVKDFHVKNLQGLPIREALSGFITQFYNKEILPPPEIIIRQRPAGQSTLRKWLAKKRGSPVSFVVAEESRRLDLLKMAEQNASTSFRLRGGSSDDYVAEELALRLGLSQAPRSIGAFDISTISGSDSVGAFIYWSTLSDGGSTGQGRFKTGEGRFKKEYYRHLRIKTVTGVDDYSMMREVVGRVAKNLGEAFPDLVVIDGGRGQLEAAIRALAGVEGVRAAIVSIAKDPDRVFIPGKPRSISIEDGSQASMLMKRIRDEVHRFAITYHRKLRDKRLLQSPLERVRGMTRKRRVALLKRFDGIETIMKATVEEIASVEGFNKKSAENLLKELQNLRELA